MNGFICLDKPAGPSSFTALKSVQRTLGIKKMGHAGTLDPAASGLLVMAINEATRLLPYLKTEPKVYDFEIQFGIETDTLDATGTVLRANHPIPTREDIEGALPKFKGDITQQAPRYSATKISGVRSYERARNNEEFEPREKVIRIDAFTLAGYNLQTGLARCSVTCSSGTYVRSLARDVALQLNTVAHAPSIRRTMIGSFSLSDAITPATLLPSSINRVISLRSAFGDTEFIPLADIECRRIMNGGDITIRQDTLIAGDRIFACDKTGTVIAVLQRIEGNCYHPACVLNQPSPKNGTTGR